jgi:hypothetical protein
LCASRPGRGHAEQFTINGRARCMTAHTSVRDSDEWKSQTRPETLPQDALVFVYGRELIPAWDALPSQKESGL